MWSLPCRYAWDMSNFSLLPKGSDLSSSFSTGASSLLNPVHQHFHYMVMNWCWPVFTSRKVGIPSLITFLRLKVFGSRIFKCLFHLIFPTWIILKCCVRIKIFLLNYSADLIFLLIRDLYDDISSKLHVEGDVFGSHWVHVSEWLAKSNELLATKTTLWRARTSPLFIWTLFASTKSSLELASHSETWTQCEPQTSPYKRSLEDISYRSPMRRKTKSAE